MKIKKLICASVIAGLVNSLNVVSAIGPDRGTFQIDSIQLKSQELKDKFRKELIEKEAPSFELVNMKGEIVRLEDYRGKILVLDFWATWCGPCVISLPGMQAAVDKYENDPEVEFLFINAVEIDENYKGLVERLMIEKGFTFNVVFDEMVVREKATYTAYDIKKIPAKFFIDQKGVIRFESFGGTDDIEKIVDEVDARIALIRELGTEYARKDKIPVDRL